MTEQLKEIGTRLEELRDICGVSAEEMAEKLENLFKRKLK